MFEDLIEKPRPKRWKTAVIVGSALIHAAALGGVAVAAMWKIDKLDLASAADITFQAPLPPGESAPPPAARLAVAKATTKPPKVKPPVPVQPTVVKDPVQVTATGAATTDDPDAVNDGPGGDGNDPDADPLSTGRCLTPPCSGIETDREPPPVVERTEVKKPPIVPPNVAKGLRVSGNDQIFPPELVRVDMLHQGKDKVQATVQICVGADGTVDQVRLMKATGFASYDDKLVGEMRAWRYKPYLVDGRPSPMCTVAIVIYRMRK